MRAIRPGVWIRTREEQIRVAIEELCGREWNEAVRLMARWFET